ncbi:hypothetical protein SPRG_16683 [Saprolegnia parasitica CBS 223.65]|uniref:Uncharacterized protein n=1 Tax=Saprolegnia parasitica (strain CBS 223.65) TaxID=695850 RepID=A0A067BTD7_SAPPC|nr:hypothetical protein SPRG_16683 [Saprolegnia parasitica CBS 223.65]KDO17912.1 hypothetical protein SPRG_16683 [Saprolegnia parasitica CBS 223.65]|eukprot:XP_012211379.1 hypothetical protein SPRG_16683 [Saprolegnia parasitica CBS 223.65]
MPPPPTKAFDLHSFRAALKAGKLEKAKAELTKCIGHEAEIRQVYGETQLRSTPLYHILEGPLTGSREEAKALLEHAVMRAVIQMKWEAFGMRMYLEQLLVYGVLLLSMTLSVATSYARRPTDAFPVQVLVWAVTLLSLLLSLLACRVFSYRRKELWCLVTSSLCAVIGGVLYANDAAIEAFFDYATFVSCNHVTLLLSGAYFLLFELAELFGEVPAESRVVHVAGWPLWLQRGAYWVVIAPFDLVL